MEDKIKALLEDIYHTIDLLEQDMQEASFGGTPFMKGQWCAYRNVADSLKGIIDDEDN